ncbi:MAG: hypothetical protein FJ125_00790 [Deltaproteobacteria bacterium]|nr:hypothetical protein [Deltaproteobacteria bacterium]
MIEGSAQLFCGDVKYIERDNNGNWVNLTQVAETDDGADIDVDLVIGANPRASVVYVVQDELRYVYQSAAGQAFSSATVVDGQSDGTCEIASYDVTPACCLVRPAGRAGRARARRGYPRA